MKVKSSYRSMKIDLKTRVISQLARRTSVQFFIFLAYHLLISMEYRMRKKYLKHV